MVQPSNTLEKCRGFLSTQIRRADKDGRFPSDEPMRASVTLSRQTGAGAVPLADKLALYLTAHDKPSKAPWTVFDKNLVRKVLDDHDLPAQLERIMPEDRPHAVEEALSDILGTRPSDWTLNEHTRDTVFRLARMGNVIIVGRGGNLITRGLPNVFRLRLIASLEFRVPRCMEVYGLNEAEARAFIAREDRARRRFIRAFFDADIEKPAHYSMVVNLDQFADEALVRVMGDSVLSFAGTLPGAG